MKSQFNFYVRAVGDSGPYNAHHTPRNKPAWAGRQSEFVATVVIKLEFVENTREPYYRVGVCVKNQKDGLPFIKKEGRQMALDRANNSAPVSTMDDVWHLILSGLSQQKNQKIANLVDFRNLDHRIRKVLWMYTHSGDAGCSIRPGK